MVLFKFKVIMDKVISRLGTTENQRRELEDQLKMNSRNSPRTPRKNNSKQ